MEIMYLIKCATLKHILFYSKCKCIKKPPIKKRFVSQQIVAVWHALASSSIMPAIHCI